MKRELKADSACQDLPSKISGFKTDPDEKGTESSWSSKGRARAQEGFKTDPDEKGTESLLSSSQKRILENSFKTDPDEKGTESWNI